MKKRKFFIRPFAVHWESAVFMGNDGEVTNAKQIYGKEFTRIRQIDQLSKAAGRLIQKEIRELYS